MQRPILTRRNAYLLGLVSLNLLIGFLIASFFYYRDPFRGLGYQLASREDIHGGVSASLSGLSLQETYNQIADRNLNAVVSVQVTAAVEEQGNPFRDYFGDDELRRRFFGLPKERNQKRKAQVFGSGFIISKDGYLVSNFHVVKNAEKITVRLKDSDKELEALVIGTDPDSDVALLKIKNTGVYPYVLFGDSENVQIGDIAVAIGNPFGLASTFTTGVISAKGRTGIGNKIENFIQTDVAINPGNSGGPLLNVNGEVIGVNSMIYSQSGGSVGIGFAIPINLVKNIVDQLKKNGKVSRSYLGIELQELTGKMASDLDVEKQGVYVPQVAKGSPAEKAGILAGDIVLSVDGKNLKSVSDFKNYLTETEPGKKITVELLRNKKPLKLIVTVEGLSENQASDGNKPGTFLGIQAGAMPPDLLKLYQTKDSFAVVIEDLAEDSPLLERGVEPGDLIVMVNYQETKTMADYENVMKKAMSGKKVIFHIQRGSQLRAMAVFIK